MDIGHVCAVIMKYFQTNKKPMVEMINSQLHFIDKGAPQNCIQLFLAYKETKRTPTEMFKIYTSACTVVCFMLSGCELYFNTFEPQLKQADHHAFISVFPCTEFTN